MLRPNFCFLFGWKNIIVRKVLKVLCTKVQNKQQTADFWWEYKITGVYNFKGKIFKKSSHGLSVALSDSPHSIQKFSIYQRFNFLLKKTTWLKHPNIYYPQWQNKS